MLSEGALRAGTLLVSADVRQEAERRVLAALDAGHVEDSLRVSVPLSRIRAGLPDWAPTELADPVIDALCDARKLERADGGVRRAGFRPELTADQDAASARLYDLLSSEGLGAPLVDELPDDLTGRSDFWPLVRHLESTGRVKLVADGLYVASDEIDAAVERIRAALGGRNGLGPADFRAVLPVSRKHLIPLLNYFDGAGVTLRQDEGRSVPGA
jgi:selenocysteine-specific elongation factor